MPTEQADRIGRRQFINQPHDLVSEALAGLELSHPRLVRWNREPSYVVRAEPPSRPKVGLISGGGSGHEPLHTGFVGAGMLDAAVPGAIFSSPTVEQVYGATSAVDRGEGVLHIIKNYTGDLLNFGLAADLATADGTEIATVIVDDDLATDTDDGGPGRRGTAAVVAVEKICGAAAERGAGLAEVAALGARVAAGARTMAVALHACTHPGASRPSFDLEPGEVELGIGIHGERGIERSAFAPAAVLADKLAGPLGRRAPARGRGPRHHDRQRARLNSSAGAERDVPRAVEVARGTVDRARPRARRTVCDLARHGRLLDHVDSRR